jgi:hypothetical protein
MPPDASRIADAANDFEQLRRRWDVAGAGAASLK